MASEGTAQTQPDLELISAVKQVDVDKVESILQSTHNIKEVMNRVICVDGQMDVTTTALLEACKGVSRLCYKVEYDTLVEKFIRIARLLLDHGADPTITGGHQGRTFIPFHFAVTSGNLTLIELLANGKTEVNQTDHDGQSALHMYCEHSRSASILTTLIEYQADVNLQDKNGKTPLHISCARKLDLFCDYGLTAEFLKNGALATIKDNNGECPLHMAAVKDSRTLLDMVDLCFAEPKESMELIIEALELTALLKSCPDQLECMRRATQLRIEHDIQKKILAPMECYGFHKEWKTIEELEAYKGDKTQLKLQAVLARERIHQGQREKLMNLINEEFISDVLEASKCERGKLLEHHLQICSYEGRTDYDLYIAMSEWKKELTQHFESFDTMTIVKLVKVTIKNLPDKKIWSSYFMDLLSTIITMVMHLYRRQAEGTSEDEQSLAKKLLEELINKVPMVLDEICGTLPVQHVITKINFMFPTADTSIISRTPYDYELMKMLLESTKIKPNVTDSQGNTILHSAVECIDADVHDFATRQTLCQGLINHAIPTIKLLLEKGVYPNARNRKYETAQDMVHLRYEVDDAEIDPIEVAYIEIRELLQQYEDQYSMTLLTKAAVVVSGLPCRDHLKGHCPDGLIDFVNLHGDLSNIEQERSCSEHDSESDDSVDSDDSDCTILCDDDITGERYKQY